MPSPHPVALTLARDAIRRGKRKRAKPPPKKAKPKVAQIFDCPFCGKTSSCACRMDLEHSIGSINCDGCGAKYQMRISNLTDPIDIYSEWIDKSDQVNAGNAGDAEGLAGGGEEEEDDYEADDE